MLHLLSDTENLNHAVAESVYLTRFKKFLEYRASKFEPKYFVTCYYGRSYEGDYLKPDTPGYTCPATLRSPLERGWAPSIRRCGGRGDSWARLVGRPRTPLPHAA